MMIKKTEELENNLIRLQKSKSRLTLNIQENGNELEKATPPKVHKKGE